MRVLTILLSAVLLSAPLAWCDDEHHHALTAEEVGSVHFATSCSKSVTLSFNRAVALLHSFQYEQAREAFSEVASRDPKCAMAQWGVAMSYYHGLWKNGNTAAGREAFEKAKAVAAGNPKTTPRELAYIGALDEIYRQDDKDQATHDRAFEQKMGVLQAAYPNDSEAAIFHALTLDVAAPKTDKTFANQQKCGEILEPLFKLQPHHPGIPHYIIHCYDNPVLAEKSLDAARVYAKIAPASAHANHMPSHIFTRLGLWDESIRSNIRSEKLATEAEATSTNGEARDQRLHAMDYEAYAYLQSGQVKQAEAVLAKMNSLPPIGGLTLTGNYALAAIPARCAIELGNWKQASELQVRNESVPWAQAITWTSIGEGSARNGDLDRAVQAEQMLATVVDAIAKKNNAYWSNQVEVQRREVAAWIAEKSGKSSDAIAMLKSAAELEESMDKDAVTPGPVTPARELLAELLLLEKRPQEALAEYEAVLKVAPNRFNALFGAASAADAAGNSNAADRYFRKLSEISVGEERPELVTAHKRIAVTAEKNSETRP
jgi:tetratricopeptide (TPR) repeat protein